MIWFLAAAFASPDVVGLGPPAGPPGQGHPPGPPPPERLVDRAEAIGVAPETVDAMRRLVATTRPTFEAAVDALDAAQDALRTELEADRPDRAQVLAANHAVAEAEEALRATHLQLELDLRARLTAEEWEQVRPPAPPERPPHHPGW